MKRECVNDALPWKWWAVLGLPEIGGVAVERLTVYGAIVEGLEQTILLSLDFGFCLGLALGLGRGLQLSGGWRGRLWL